MSIARRLMEIREQVAEQLSADLTQMTAENDSLEEDYQYEVFGLETSSTTNCTFVASFLRTAVLFHVLRLSPLISSFFFFFYRQPAGRLQYSTNTRCPAVLNVFRTSSYMISYTWYYAALPLSLLSICFLRQHLGRLPLRSAKLHESMPFFAHMIPDMPLLKTPIFLLRQPAGRLHTYHHEVSSSTKTYHTSTFRRSYVWTSKGVFPYFLFSECCLLRPVGAGARQSLGVATVEHAAHDGGRPFFRHCKPS